MSITFSTTQTTVIAILAQKKLAAASASSLPLSSGNSKTASLQSDTVSRLLNWSPDQKSEASEALDKLEQARKQFQTDRKGAARERLAQIKKQLEMLRNFGGDPKAIARIAKQLAQELKAAAKDYGDAVKAGASEPATPSASAEQTTATSETAPASEGAADPDAERKAATGQVNEKIAQSDARYAARKEDTDTLEEFKSVAQALKAILKRAAYEARKDKNGDPEADDFQKAARDLTDAIEKLAKTIHDSFSDLAPQDSNNPLSSGPGDAYAITAISISVEVVQTVNISA